MAKRKVWVESISRYVGAIHSGGVLYEVDIKLNGDMNQAEIDIKNKNNAGGQAWDWATSHWDEVIPEDGPNVLVGDQPVSTKLRWACITGVYSDKKGKNHLPISEVGYKSGQNSGYGRSQKQKRGGTTPKFKTKEDPKSAETRRVSAGLKGQITSQPPVQPTSNSKVKERKGLLGKVPEVPSNPLDMDAIRAAKIAKVLEEDDAKPCN